MTRMTSSEASNHEQSSKESSNISILDDGEKEMIIYNTSPEYNIVHCQSRENFARLSNMLVFDDEREELIFHNERL